MMANKLIISNQIFHIAGGGRELIPDRSRISPQLVNPFAPSGKHTHSYCLGIVLLAQLPNECATEGILSSFFDINCINTVSFSNSDLCDYKLRPVLFKVHVPEKATHPLNKVHCFAHSTSFHLCN